MARRTKESKGGIPRHLEFSSDKCDFVVRRQAFFEEGGAQIKEQQLDLTASAVKLRVASSKCDWRVVSHSAQEKLQSIETEVSRTEAGWQLDARGLKEHVRATSSKCDFRMSFTDVSQPAATAGAKKRAAPEFHHELRRQVQSSKCDWRLVVQQAGREFSLGAKAGGKDTTVSLPGLEGAVASSKCDWSLRLGTEKSMPQLQARLSSSKCDFSLRADFGLAGGRTYRLRAASSSKCDFRLDRVEFSDDGKAWKRLAVAKADEKP